MLERFWSQKTTALERDVQAVACEHRLKERLCQLVEAHKVEPLVSLEGMEEDRSHESFAISAVAVSLSLILKRSKHAGEELSFEQRFVVGLFAFLMAHELSKRLPLDLGVVMASVALEVFSSEDLSQIYELGRSYRRLGNHKSIARQLHVAIGQWFDHADEDHLLQLIAVFDLCCTPQ